MAVETPSQAFFRFGTFEVDLRSGELRKQGVRVKIQEQPFHVLTLLLQTPE
jgi:DNA-binding winged helix-turn-helix (wHTH) protein